MMECTKQTKQELSYAIDGKKIKLARAGKDWTLQRLSEVSGVSRKTIGEIEKGKKNKIRFSTIDLIAVALGEQVDNFCTQNEIIKNSRRAI